MIDTLKLTYETYTNYDLHGYTCANFYYDGLNILECSEELLEAFNKIIKPDEIDLWDDIFIFGIDDNKTIDRLANLGINRI
jgi:hypothetical protein